MKRYLIAITLTATLQAMADTRTDPASSPVLSMAENPPGSASRETITAITEMGTHSRLTTTTSIVVGVLAAYAMGRAFRAVTRRNPASSTPRDK